MPRFDGQDIFAWRTKNNLTQKQAAEVLKVPLGTFKNWEQGTRQPPVLIQTIIDRLTPADYPVDRGTEGTRPIGVTNYTVKKKPRRSKS